MPPDVRDAYTKENGQMIDEGITDLKKALELRPDYDDAMAYLNLLLRRKADEAATPDERASLLKQADDLVEKAKEIKQKKMETPAKPYKRLGWIHPEVLQTRRPGNGPLFFCVRIRILTNKFDRSRTGFTCRCSLASPRQIDGLKSAYSHGIRRHSRNSFLPWSIK